MGYRDGEVWRDGGLSVYLCPPTWLHGCGDDENWMRPLPGRFRGSPWFCSRWTDSLRSNTVQIRSTAASGCPPRYCVSKWNVGGLQPAVEDGRQDRLHTISKPASQYVPAILTYIRPALKAKQQEKVPCRSKARIETEYEQPPPLGGRRS